MIGLLRDLERDEDGTALVEYALIMSLVSIVSYFALMTVGDALEQFYAASSQGLGAVVKGGL